MAGPFGKSVAGFRGCRPCHVALQRDCPLLPQPNARCQIALRSPLPLATEQGEVADVASKARWFPLLLTQAGAVRLSRPLCLWRWLGLELAFVHLHDLAEDRK